MNISEISKPGRKGEKKKSQTLFWSRGDRENWIRRSISWSSGRILILPRQFHRAYKWFIVPGLTIPQIHSFQFKLQFPGLQIQNSQFWGFIFLRFQNYMYQGWQLSSSTISRVNNFQSSSLIIVTSHKLSPSILIQWLILNATSAAVKKSNHSRQEIVPLF